MVKNSQLDFSGSALPSFIAGLHIDKDGRLHEISPLPTGRY